MNRRWCVSRLRDWVVGGSPWMNDLISSDASLLIIFSSSRISRS